jgi:hypothetical protein
MTHQICNVLIELDGDVAHGESYFFMLARSEHQGREVDWLLAGRFIDRFERRGGAWRIASRTVAYDLDRFDEVRPAADDLPAARYLDNAVRGQRGKADHSYQEFRALPP